MIELLFVACLAGAPQECKERSLFYTDISPMQSLMGAQPELAKWAENHPTLEIKKWRCRMVDLSEKKA